MRTPCFLLLSLTLLSGCGGDGTATDEATTAAVEPVSEILQQPYTAEQIRDEWVVGLQLTLRRAVRGTRTLERWTVVGADAEGVKIEYASLDPAGVVTGEPAVERKTWEQLRDHASFPSDRAEREPTTRETMLGTLDGWIYTLRDTEHGTVSEFFFAADLPGAPVQMQMVQNGNVIAELEQIERHRPAS